MPSRSNRLLFFMPYHHHPLKMIKSLLTMSQLRASKSNSGRETVSKNGFWSLLPPNYDCTQLSVLRTLLIAVPLLLSSTSSVAHKSGTPSTRTARARRKDDFLADNRDCQTQAASQSYRVVSTSSPFHKCCSEDKVPDARPRFWPRLRTSFGVLSTSRCHQQSMAYRRCTLTARRVAPAPSPQAACASRGRLLRVGSSQSRLGSLAD